MKKKIYLFALGFLLLIPSVRALNEKVVGSWATKNEGVFVGSYDNGYQNRTILANSLFEADATEENGREFGFTGVGYFTSGITYYFDKYENDVKTHNAKLVSNPNENEPDLRLTEVTWDGDNSNWIGEGVMVYAVNYNGTNEERLLAYAYNKTAILRAKNKGIELAQVEGAKVEFVYQSQEHNLYDTLIYFPEDFKYCTAIKLVDVTESLKYLGGNGQNTHDGYDIDAIYGYKILYTPVEDYELKGETAVSVGDYNVGCEKSWQKIVMKIKVADLIDSEYVFDIVAGQHYKIGTGKVYLDDGVVSVSYEIFPYLDDIVVKDSKIGIYKNLSNIMKDGKLIGNGKIINNEHVTLDDEYVYVRLHLDVEIPVYLYDFLDQIDHIDKTCEINTNNKNFHRRFDTSLTAYNCKKNCCKCNAKNNFSRMNYNKKLSCNH